MRASQIPLITVGVGKTHLATAIGHVGIRRRRSVLFTRADQLFRQLKAARLDNSVEAEMRRLTRVELLIIDLSRLGDYPDSRSDRMTQAL
jgi:DNA replication protein DnaC